MPAPPPRITETSRPFWDGLRAETIVLQCCAACRRWIFYPRILCPHCGATDLAWQPVSGRATLYTFTVAEVPVSPDFAEDVPQLLAVAELAEGVRLATTLVDIHPDDIRIGMPLAPVFDHARFEGITMLRFKPA